MEVARSPRVRLGSPAYSHSPKNVHVRQTGNSTLATESACEREWLFIFQCGRAISRRLVQGVSRQLGLAAAAGETVAEKWNAWANDADNVR